LGLGAPIGQICTVANDTAKFRPTDQIGGYARGFRWWRSLCGGYLFTGAGGFDLGEGHPDGDLPLVAGDLA
jgi:hypothetical protein